MTENYQQISYHHLKSTNAMLKRTKKFNLVSMSISLQTKTKLHDTYVVAGAGFARDLTKLQFITFSRQTLLNQWLDDNPSGFYQESTPLHWTVGLYKPEFDYRIFTVKQQHYMIVRITNGGLVYNLLMNDKDYQLPFMLKPISYKNKHDYFNWAELVNLGLLGRILNITYNTNLINFHQNIKGLEGIAPLTYENDQNRNGYNHYVFPVFFGTKEPMYIHDLQNVNKLEAKPDQVSIKEWKNQKAFPKTEFILNNNAGILKLEIEPILSY